MLGIAESQFELRHVSVPTITSFPVAIAAGGFGSATFQTTIPEDEHWFILGATVCVAVDNILVLAQAGLFQIYSRGAAFALPLSVTVPLQVTNLPIAVVGIGSALLPGTEGSRGNQIQLYMEFKNTDAVGRNLVATNSFANLLIRPAKCLSEIAVAQVLSEGMGAQAIRQRFGR